MPPPPYSFPVMASAAPVVGAMVMWAITHSVYLLAFAFLGPAIALGSVLDARWKGARTMRREKSRFTAELAAARSAIDTAHTFERAALRDVAPSPSRVLALAQSDPERWRRGLEAHVQVSIGTGSVPSSLVPDASGSEGFQEVNAALRELRENAVLLENAPVIVDARERHRCVRPGAVAVAVARGIVLQLANTLSPAADPGVVHHPLRVAGRPAASQRPTCGRGPRTAGCSFLTFRRRRVHRES